MFSPAIRCVFAHVFVVPAGLIPLLSLLLVSRLALYIRNLCDAHRFPADAQLDAQKILRPPRSVSVLGYLFMPSSCWK
ncbi:hypothetical protein EDD17DRAFT_1609711 [Pisolithus thermaeus]|nr:hypothetical protein EDD17DRAFT_1609711 [Pisolithus thermaeus]